MMKHVWKRLTAVLLVFAMLLPMAGAFAEDAEHVEYSGTEVTGALGKINTTANFRSVPSTKTGKILAEIAKGTQVEITAIPDNEDDGWYRVRYDGQSGYVYCDLVDVINAGTPVKDAELNGAKGQVTADGVRLREEANTNADVLASLNEGTEVELLTIPNTISENDWYKVRWNGQVGYIQSNFIRVTDQGDKDDPVVIAKGVTVNTNGVNFRKGPGKNYTSMGKLPSGIEVDIIEIPSAVGEAYWYFVRYKGELGYIQSPYIKVLGQDGPSLPEEDEPDAPQVEMSTGITTSASGVNFRTGPSKKHSIYGKIPLDTVVELLSIPTAVDEDHWYKVRYNNKTGYVQSPYIRVLTVREEDLPQVEEFGYAKLIKDTKVNLRQTAGGDTITQWSGRGSLMRITGEPQAAGLYNWYPVYHVERGTILFVREDMIEVVMVKDGEIVEPEPEPESPYGYVITTDYGVNLRIKPAEDYIAQIPINTVLTCVGPTQTAVMSGVNYTWFQVRYNGMTGWVRGDCVRVCTSTGGNIVEGDEPVVPEEPDKPEDSTTVVGYIRITGNRVALRKTPGGDVQTRIETGTVMPLMGETVDQGFYFWYPVRDANNLFGWIRGDCAVPCNKDGSDIGTDEPVTPPEEEEPDLVGATAKITTNTNFREEADASDKENIICVIPADAVVTVLRIPEDTENGWYKIRYNGETGYVYGKYVKMITEGGEEGEQPAPSAYGYIMITGNRVAVRKTPGGTLQTRVETGTVWPLIGESKEKDGVEWFNAEAGGYKGYVHGEYAFKLSPEQEESYLAGNGVPEETPEPEDVPSDFLMVVNTNGLNIRESASQDSTSFGRVGSGTVMQFFDTKQVGSVTWYCVLYDHRERWVHGNYVDELTVAEYEALVKADPDLAPDASAFLGYVRTNQDNVYIRNAADGSTYIEKVLKKGTVMRYYTGMIYAGNNGWYRVLSPEGEWGYVRTDLITQCDENGADLPVELPGIGDTTSAPQMQQETSYSTLVLGDGPNNSKGTKVMNLVQELINQGYYKGALTDTYTSAVQAAVKAFQTVKGLDVDGKAGSATQHALFGTVPIGAGNTNNLDFTIYPVEKIDWFTGGIQDMIPRGANFKVYDVKTGIVWWAHRWAGGSHADIETLTAADSARLCEAYGVKKLQDIVDQKIWERRPCLITIGTRTFAASLDGMQHNPAGDTISNNGMDGQVCLHFTNSKGHESGAVSESHAKAIEYAYNNCPAGQKK